MSGAFLVRLKAADGIARNNPKLFRRGFVIRHAGHEYTHFTPRSLFRRAFILLEVRGRSDRSRRTVPSLAQPQPDLPHDHRLFPFACSSSG